MYDIEKRLAEFGSNNTDFDGENVRDLLKKMGYSGEPVEFTASDPVTMVTREMLEQEASYPVILYRDVTTECELTDGVFWSPDKKRAIISFE